MAKPTTVDEYLAALPTQLGDAARAAQIAIDAALPEAGRGVLWHGHPVWRSAGAPVCLLKAYPSYVTFGLWKGQAITDPEQRLEPGAREMAHIKLRSADDADAALITDWLAQARALETSAG